MRFKLTLLLLLANVAVFYVIWSLSRSGSEAPGRFVTPSTPTVERIAIEGKSLARPRVFESLRNGRWKMTSPVEWLANPHAVNGILSQLQLLPKEIHFSLKEIQESGRSLADYGLDDPSLTLTVTADKIPYVLKVGATTQIGNRVYLLAPDGETIIVAPQELLQILSLDLEDVRARQIFTIPVFEVRSLSVRTASDDVGAAPESGLTGQRVGIVKTADGWRMETPVQARADAKAVEAELARLTQLEANRFVQTADKSPAAYGLSAPSLRVTLEGNTRQTLLLGRQVPQTKTPQFYAQLEGNPEVFTVDAAPFEALRKAQETLRDKHLLYFNPQALTALEILGPGGKPGVRLQRLENGDWQALAEDKTARVDPIPADTAQVAALLKDLTDLSAAAFLTNAPSAENLKTYGLSAPVRTLTLTVKDAPTLTLSLGLSHTDAKTTIACAAVSGTNTVFQVHPSILEALSLEPLHYRARTLATLPDTAIIGKCTLTDLASKKVIFETVADAPSPAFTDVQKSAFAVLVQSLKSFQAASFVSASCAPEGASFEGRSLPWRYRLTADIALPSGTDKPKQETLVYDFSERLGGTAQVGGAPQAGLTFLLPQALIDALFVFTEKAPTLESKP